MDKIDFLLEKYINGDASAEEISFVESHKHLMEKVSQLQAENKDFLERYPARVLLNKEKSNKKISLFSNLQRILLPTGGILSLGLALVLFIQPEIERTKGGETAIYVNQLTENGVEQLKDQASVEAFKSIQIEYSHGTQSHGAIFSVDSKGAVTLHFPNTMSESTKLSLKSRVALDFAYKLDDTPGQEKFYFFFSNNEIDLNKISNGLKNTIDPKSFGYDFKTFVINKKEAKK